MLIPDQSCLVTNFSQAPSSITTKINTGQHLKYKYSSFGLLNFLNRLSVMEGGGGGEASSNSITVSGSANALRANGCSVQGDRASIDQQTKVISREVGKSPLMEETG